MSDIFLSVENIYKSFVGVKALQNVSMTIKKGEIRCLVGENGCGKSTLIKIISGVYKKDSGDIKIEGQLQKKLTPMGAINKGIQVIYQDFSIFPNLTVAENIAMNTLRAKGRKLIDWKFIRKKAQKTLDRVHVTMDLDKKVEDLSVADKQLVAICRALTQDAKLIIMDEPTTALTKKEVDALLDVIKKLQKDGISIVFVSHKLDEVMEISDTVTILRNGQNVIDGNASDFDPSKFAYYMTGREIESTAFVPELENGEELLRVDNLSVKGGFEDVSFTLNKGDVMGITGLLGSGRTELAMTLFGRHRVAAGSIYINGKLAKIGNIQDAVKYGIGYVPEDRLTEGLFLTQSIARNIYISVISKFKTALGTIKRGKVKELVDDLVAEFSIKTPNAENAVGTLSGGNQQRVVLAKWLASKPQILILNGPTVGVDIGSKHEIHRILRALANQGMGVIIISDDIPEVLDNCNKILVMKKGRIVGQTTNQEITQDELSAELG